MQTKEQVSVYNRDYARANKRKIEKRRGIRNKENAVSYRLRVRKHHLKTLGWTPELYDAKFHKQKGKCEICGQKETIKRQRLSADHKHGIVPKPRGLLCSNCNIGIGNLQENIKILKSAILYLQKYKTQ